MAGNQSSRYMAGAVPDTHRQGRLGWTAYSLLTMQLLNVTQFPSHMRRSLSWLSGECPVVRFNKLGNAEYLHSNRVGTNTLSRKLGDNRSASSRGAIQASSIGNPAFFVAVL